MQEGDHPGTGSLTVPPGADDVLGERADGAERVHHAEHADEAEREVLAHARRAVDEMSALATYVEQLAAKFPLRDHQSLRSQMRRAAGDALTHAACAVEAGQASDYRSSLMRTRGALGELAMFYRLGEKAGSLTPTEASHLAVMIQMVEMALRCALDDSPFVAHTVVDATRAA